MGPGPQTISTKKLTEARAILSSDGVAYVQKTRRLLPGANRNGKSALERRIGPNREAMKSGLLTYGTRVPYLVWNASSLEQAFIP